MSPPPFAQERARHEVSAALPSPSFPTRPGSSTSIDSRSEASLTAENFAQHPTTSQRLLTGSTIFDFFVKEYLLFIKDTEAWQSLVHPKHLRITLDAWPPLPLIIHDSPSSDSLDDIIALLRVEHRDRNRDPFPELTYLSLHSREETVPLLPDSFLGGTTPRLECFELVRIPFPGLPKLHLAAPHLVDLRLLNIPHSGYFSPEAMATVLSTLTNLQYLWLEFQSPRSRPDWASRHPPTRSLLPVLTYFSFNGVSEYLDNLVARIGAPRLNDLDVTFFNQITPSYRVLKVEILCRESDWQVSSLEQVCTSCLPPLSALEVLYIDENPHSQPDWKDNIENTLWRELLHPFTTVKNLYLSDKIAPLIAPALQELNGDRTTETLPILQNIFLEGFQLSSGPIQEGIGQFVAARQVTNHPTAVTCWERKWNVDENDYV
ncbi:hypothetical protein DFH94DRAFT_850046 [Russula ochroleuca]|uniref:Uncharacterized protein n=1 Tax=Russula ochroleuca TaxID=152965 RepID=A0A9P5N420_9AGAM|nr:hypothetical protein DFH94DRAFT_850046 [Russula ochroleuca]